MRPLPANSRVFGRQTGFTLLEMIVVVAVLGLLTIGLTQGVRAGLTLWDAQSRRTGETAELDAAARVLRTLLSGITPSPAAGFGAGGASSPEMKGTADSFSFVSDLPTGLGTTRRADITLALSQGRLVLRWTPHRHELSISPAPEPTDRAGSQRRPPRTLLLGLTLPGSGGGLAYPVGRAGHPGIDSRPPHVGSG